MHCIVGEIKKYLSDITIRAASGKENRRKKEKQIR
jgi:hypothetical protein